MNIGITGKSGEDMVAAFLRNKGYKIIKRNYACRYGEIDIIAQLGEYIVFVEVKTRKKGSLISGVAAVDAKKQQRLLLTANDFICKSETELQPRFDVAEVTVSKSDDGNNRYHLNYIKNAF